MPSRDILLILSPQTASSDITRRLSMLGHRPRVLVGMEEAARIGPGSAELLIFDHALVERDDDFAKARELVAGLNMPALLFSNPQDETAIRHLASTEPPPFLIPTDLGDMLPSTLEAIFGKELASLEQAAEPFYRRLVQMIPDAVWLSQSDGRLVDCNEAALRMLGCRERSEAVGKPVLTFIDGQDWPRAIADGLKMTRNPTLTSRYTGRRKDGTTFPMEAHMALISPGAGRSSHFLSVLRDISLQVEYEQEITRRVALSEALAHISAEFNSRLSLPGVLDNVCEEITRLLGINAAGVLLYSEQEDALVLSAGFAQGSAGHPDFFRPLPRAHFERLEAVLGPVIYLPEIHLFPEVFDFLNRNPRLQTLALTALRHDGRLVGLLAAGSLDKPHPLDQSDFSILRAVANQAAVAIANTQLFEQISTGRKRLQVLSRRLVETQEAERRAVAHELHDEIGQLLTGLQFSLESLKEGTAQDRAQRIEESQTLVRRLINEVRELSLNLRPALIDEQGLRPALEAHFARLRRQTGLQVKLCCHNLERRFKPEIEIAAFRLVQEGLTNVLRHAGVMEAEVSASAGDETLTILVADSGKGFDTHAALAEGAGSGLAGMRERANLLGGRFSIESTPGQGTRLQTVLPLHRPLERRKNERNRLAGG